MLNPMFLSALDNKTTLLVLAIVLIVFIVLLAVLAVVFIVALRKRAPVVKIVMAPLAAKTDEEDTQSESPVEQTVAAQSPSGEPVPPPPSADAESESEADDETDEGEDAVFVTEGQERVRYDRSLTAKICQLKNETKEWYTELKNELLSYEKVRDRMSWKRETFRVGRMTFARLAVRGKTLCLFLAVEPDGYKGTKYTVDDASGAAATADTPTLYRIKSARRLKYAKELIAGLMKELKIYKNPRYEAQDFFMPYEGDMALMQRGLVKRIVSGSTRTFKIEEVDNNAFAEAAAATDKTAFETSKTDETAENADAKDQPATAADATDGN